MIKNYFKTAWRSLLKNKVSSFINISGLSVGLATSILIMLVIVDELRYNRFHTNLKDIYVVMINSTLGGQTGTSRVVPGPLAASLRSEIPEVKYAVRVSQGEELLVKAGDKSTYEQALYAEPDFFNMMTFPALAGDPVAALREPGSVVITERTARKLFGSVDVIGKILVVEAVKPLKIAAVIRDVPQNSSNKFDLVLSFVRLERENSWLSKWDDNRILTWLQLKPNANLAVVNAKMAKFFMERRGEKNITLFAYPFAELRLHGQFRNGRPVGGTIDTIMMLGAIGLFVLLIACINFMNLATARSERRAREVGVRKVLGASRSRIIFQFLGEAMLLSLLAFLLGGIIAYLALPGFMRLIVRAFTPELADWRVWGLLLALGILTGLAAGSYPAFYLSRFQPVRVLKKLMDRERGGNLLRKGLVTFQFVISIFLLIATIVIYRQVHYLQDRPIGYTTENLIDIRVRGDITNKFAIVRNELSQIEGIKEITAGTDNLVRFGQGINGVEWPGKTADQDFMFSITFVEYNWTKTIGLRMAEGRDFSPEYGMDSLACLVNQEAVRRMGLKGPVVGTKLGGRTIIGVVEDFIHDNPSKSMRPLLIHLGKGGMSHFFVRVANDEQWRTSVSKIEKVIRKFSPDYPFEFRFTKDEYQKMFNEANALSQMTNVFGGLAIFISCLGLFGLSAFLAERRSKEVSIRKVFGAGVGSLWFSLSKDFLKPVLIAFLLAAPLGGWVMQQMLSKMEYRIQLSWWIFALAGILAILVALVTVSFHGVKAALANPAKALASE